MEKEIENKLTKRVNQGENVRKIRQILGMKQDFLAQELGVTQQVVSRWEQKRELDDATLTRIASALHVSPKIIEEMEENSTSICIENNTFEFESGSTNNGSIGSQNDNGTLNDNKTIHPVDKLIELCKEHVSLYERMLTAEKEKIAVLEQLLKTNKAS